MHTGSYDKQSNIPSMIVKQNLCLARTRSGSNCTKAPIKGKTRCRLHGGLSTGPRTAEGKARIAAAHWKHGRRSKKFVEMRAKIWKELREIEARMRADGLI